MMSCRSAIYTVNSGTNYVSNGGVIPIGNVVRRFGRNLSQEGTGIVALGDGYYKVTATFTVLAGEAGVIGVELLNNASVVTGASQAVASASGDAVNITVVALIRNVCCDSRSFLEFVMSSGYGSVSQSSVVVEKI